MQATDPKLWTFQAKWVNGISDITFDSFNLCCGPGAPCLHEMQLFFINNSQNAAAAANAIC